MQMLTSMQPVKDLTKTIIPLNRWRTCQMSRKTIGLISQKTLRCAGSRTIRRSSTVLPFLFSWSQHSSRRVWQIKQSVSVNYTKVKQHHWLRLPNSPAPSSLDHTLCCRKGDLIIQRHNEICDAIGDLTALVWGRVSSLSLLLRMPQKMMLWLLILMLLRRWTSQVIAWVAI